MEDAEAQMFMSSPISSTPVLGEISYLLPHYQIRKESKVQLHKKYKPSYAIITVSILQTLSFALVKEQSHHLRFDPNHQNEVWRFISYMLVHDSWYHLVLNLITQCLFASILELQQDGTRTLLIYFGGGVIGALGAACSSPDMVIGASAGVYALLISLLADTILNYKVIKYKKTRLTSVGIIVACDVTHNFIHFKNKGFPSISWGAHMAGGLTGLCLGFFLYKKHEDGDQIRNIFFYLGGFLMLVLLTMVSLVDYQIRKCTPPHLIHSKYRYFC